MTFMSPWAWLLLLLALLPVAWWRHRGGRGRSAVAFSSVAAMAEAGSACPSWAVRLRWVPGALRAGALALLQPDISLPTALPLFQSALYVAGALVLLVMAEQRLAALAVHRRRQQAQGSQTWSW